MYSVSLKISWWRKLCGGGTVLLAAMIFSIAVWPQLNVLTTDSPEQMYAHRSGPDLADYI